MTMDSTLAKELAGVRLGVRPEFDSVVLEYKRRFPGKGTGFYDPPDWNRLLHAYELVVGDSVLDIGPGNGAFLNVLAESKRFTRICGIDIHRHSMLVVPDAIEFKMQSVTEMDFADDEFDTVCCMEVLEHLEVPDLPQALAHLRRVARRRLVCCLPYNEPYPWYGHDMPGGHRQNFDDAKLGRLFPRAIAALVPRYKVPWIMIVEDARAERDAFNLVAMAEMKQVLAAAGA